MDKFMEESSKLLESLKKAKGAAFSIPSTESFMGTIGCTKIKAPSLDKSDIHIIIHDLRTNMTPLLGFSIKSQLGTPSTLLNAGKTTNITYHLYNNTRFERASRSRYGFGSVYRDETDVYIKLNLQIRFKK